MLGQKKLKHNSRGEAEENKGEVQSEGGQRTQIKAERRRDGWGGGGRGWAEGNIKSF